jgi:hypothetical protein
MSAKVKCTDEPLGKLRVILDFLPLLKNLVFLDEEMTVEWGIIMAGRAKKTEHAGPKKGSGAYWGRKADAKCESNRVRRENAKRAVRQGLTDSGV